MPEEALEGIGVPHGLNALGRMLNRWCTPGDSLDKGTLLMAALELLCALVCVSPMLLYNW